MEGEDTLISHQRSKSIISYHQHSASQALIDLFPDVPLERSKFSRQSITNKIHLLFSSPLDSLRLSSTPLLSTCSYVHSRLLG